MTTLALITLPWFGLVLLLWWFIRHAARVNRARRDKTAHRLRALRKFKNELLEANVEIADAYRDLARYTMGRDMLVRAAAMTN